jgi:hypothetical protein
VSISEEKLGGVDQALEDLGKTEADIEEVRGRFSDAGGADLSAVDAELGALAEGVAVEVPQVALSEPAAEGETWDDDETEVEVLDESDFVLLVDEDDLEELEKVGEDDAVRVTTPPEIPREAEGDEEDDGFFKKLFGGRRSRPPQP